MGTAWREGGTIASMALTVTISGSYRKHLSAILAARETLVDAGARVLRPTSAEVVAHEGGLVRLAGDPDTAAGVRAAQLDAIRRSELLYVVNPGGYLGSAVMLEVGFASALGVPIAFSEPPFEGSASGLEIAVGDARRALARIAATHLDPADATLLAGRDPKMSRGSQLERGANGLMHHHDDGPSPLVDTCEYCRLAYLVSEVGG